VTYRAEPRGFHTMCITCGEPPRRAVLAVDEWNHSVEIESCSEWVRRFGDVRATVITHLTPLWFPTIVWYVRNSAHTPQLL